MSADVECCRDCGLPLQRFLNVPTCDCPTWYVTEDEAAGIGAPGEGGWYADAPGTDHGTYTLGPFPCRNAAKAARDAYALADGGK